MKAYDLVVRNGLIFDGSGLAPFEGDLAISGDSIAGMGSISGGGRKEIDARGLAVAPGFVKMMSWANESMLEDGRSQSNIRQGVTLEVLGEGWSMGPLNDALREYKRGLQGDIKYDITWTTLDEYLTTLTRRGVSPNVTSFVGAGSVRANVVGFEDRRASDVELQQMRALVRQAMLEGALGVSSSLIYSPDGFADTEELVALAEVAAQYQGIYISHLRSEGDFFLEALDEFLDIIRRSSARGEIYHLKASGKTNWHKLEEVISRIEAARSEDLSITADMYTYHAAGSGLDIMMPPWVQEGGHKAWLNRLRDLSLRQRLIDEIAQPNDGQWENGYLACGTAENIILSGFKSDALKVYTGLTLAEVARRRGASPIETAIELVVEDDSRVNAVFFLMSEENVRRKITLPWVSFCSDSVSVATEGVFLKSNPHPRAYGSFARLLGKYVRDEGLITLQEAVRRLAALPAETLRLERRGRLLKGYYADVVVFDPDRIADLATFGDPHQYAVGVEHVIINGQQVVVDGDHNGALPGRVVRGPGYPGER